MKPFFHECHRRGQWVCEQVGWNAPAGACARPARPGGVGVGSGPGPAEVRVYDDALLVLSRLGRRTRELAGLIMQYLLYAVTA